MIPSIIKSSPRRMNETSSRDIIRKHISPDPLTLPANKVADLQNADKKVELLRNFAIKGSMFDHKELSQLLYTSVNTNYQRRVFYDQLRLCGEHPYNAGALKLYADSVTSVSPMTNKAVWVTSESHKHVNVGNQLFQRLKIDEVIRDWAIRLGQYGDLFVKLHGQPGSGIEFVDDSLYPASMERIDINGRLEGFVWNGFYGTGTGNVQNMESPWSYVHGRIFGATKKYQDAAMGRYGTTAQQLEALGYGGKGPGDRKFVWTTRYGSSLLAEAVPIWKRVRMTEDTILLARVTRGMIYNLYKIKVGGGNWQQAAAMVSQYQEMLKRTTALDMSENQWRDAFAPIFAQVQDLYVPTTEDMDVDVQELGGKSADIKGIKDWEEEINQMLAANNVSKTMLGIQENSSGVFGQNAAKRVSINFAKAAQRLQVGMKLMLKRAIQIEYAYQGMDANPDRFDIRFASINSAEEEEIKDALVSGVEAIEKYMGALQDVYGEKITQEVKEKTFSLLTKRVLGIEELDLDTLIGRGMRINERTKDNAIKKIEEAVSYALHESAGDLYNVWIPSNVLCSQVQGHGELGKMVKLSESVVPGEDTPEILVDEQDKFWARGRVSFDINEQQVRDIWV